MVVQHPIPAVITALNVNGLAVARTLGRHGVPVIALHGNTSDPETRTRYVEEIWPCQGEQLVATLLERGKGLPQKPVLLPITDDSVSWIAENLAALREFYIVPMPDPDLVLKLLDKRGFDSIARAMDLPVPGTWYVESRAELAALAESMPFPCILKPQEKTPAYFRAGGQKAYVLDDLESLLSTYEIFCDAEPRVVIQQYIPGGDEEIHFCLQACADDHSAILPFAGRKLRQWRPHCGGTSACEPVQDPRLVEMTASFFQQVGMLGPCSMEYKRHPETDTYYMIEPTVCRTDWQNAVADANGAPVVYGAYCAALGLTPPAAPRHQGRRRWVLLGYDRLSADYYIRRGELGLMAWLWSIRPPIRGAYFAFDDWGPYLALSKTILRRAVAKLGRLLKLKAWTGTPA